MGEVVAIPAGRVYLDANVFIYALEGYAQFDTVIGDLMRALDRRDREAVTSVLTLAELLVGPMKTGDSSLVEAYRRHLQSRAGLRVAPITEDILVHAARLRAQGTIRLPDAIHVATAQLTGCCVFLTNDRGLKPPGMEIVLLSDLCPPPTR